MAIEPRFRWIPYWGSLTAALVAGLIAGFTPLASTLDNAAYDALFLLHERDFPPPESALLAIDEPSLQRIGGRLGLRDALVPALEALAAAQPRAVAIDIILSDPRPADGPLAAALAQTPNLVLGADIVPNLNRWEFPAPGFRQAARAVGHVHADPDPVSRRLPLMKADAETRVRLWAMTLEAYRLAHGAGSILETPRDLTVGALRIPATPESARSIRIRYRPRGVIPRLSLHELLDQPDRAAKTFQGKVVFLGFTALSEAEDRLMTPREEMLPGVEIQAHAYETIAAGRFLTDAPAWAPPAFGLLAALIAGLLFRRPPGPWAYAGAALLLLTAHLLPHVCYRLDLVFPTLMPAATAWLATGAAAVHQYFATRGRLARTESEAERYKQAIHLVTHEMRTPLTAIQGSSELMSRYNLTPEKQKQMAQMINSESKRLARMITTFLNLERLGDGAHDPKREPFPLAAALETCVERARPLAERKQIRFVLDSSARGLLLGDQELIEYAIYNLLTNAVKYSPENTTVTVTCEDSGPRQLRLAVRDQGIGMEEKDLKRIFDKFYRTRGAEVSGIEGTGIGLSLVREIVTHHGGTVEVASKPGQGSCFTLLLPAQPSAVAVS